VRKRGSARFVFPQALHRFLAATWDGDKAKDAAFSHALQRQPELLVELDLDVGDTQAGESAAALASLLAPCVALQTLYVNASTVPGLPGFPEL
jgi:hypothetical protein